MTKSAQHSAIHLEITALACQRGTHDVLHDINLNVGPGELVLLRGPNGVGKSSLLLCLAGLLHHQGAIIWSGRNPEAAPLSHLHLIGHQPALKPNLTLSENLTFWTSLNDGDSTRVLPALAEAGLGALADLETGILSAGQIRRLSLARLLVAGRPVWLLDEPTAALDTDGEKWVTSLITTQLERGGMVIAATHLDLSVPGITPRTLTLGAST